LGTSSAASGTEDFQSPFSHRPILAGHQATSPQKTARTLKRQVWPNSGRLTRAATDVGSSATHEPLPPFEERLAHGNLFSAALIRAIIGCGQGMLSFVGGGFFSLALYEHAKAALCDN